jgi:hypothetical protein
LGSVVDRHGRAYALPAEVDVFARTGVDSEALAALCRRWRVTELALFGSVLRPDYDRRSDVDVLVTFEPEASHSLFDVLHLRQELKTIFGREVDLVEKPALRNPFRRREILHTARVVYTA